MSKHISVQVELPDDMPRFRLPPGVNARLQALLDKQENGVRLTAAERNEAEGLVQIAETLSLLRMRADREGDRELGKS